MEMKEVELKMKSIELKEKELVAEEADRRGSRDKDQDNIGVKEEFKVIWKDLRTREHVIVKLAYFLKMASEAVLYSYLTVHTRSLGLNTVENGIIFSVTPVIALISPIITGFLCDKLGNFKLLLVITNILSALTALVLLLIPNARIPSGPVSPLVSAGLSCTDHRYNLLIDLKASLCEIDKKEVHVKNMTLYSCGFVCETDHNVEAIPSANWKVNFDPTGEKRAAILVSIKSPLQHRSPGEMGRPQNNSQLPENIKYFPLDHQGLECFATGRDAARCEYLPMRHRDDEFSEHWITDSALKREANTISDGSSGANNTADQHHQVSRWRFESFKSHGMTIEPICSEPEMDLSWKESVSNQSHPLKNCKAQCLVLMPRLSFCSRVSKTVDHKVQLSFWLYLILRSVLFMFSIMVSTMYHGAVIVVIQGTGIGNFGLQRCWGTVGTMTFSPISGALLAYFNRGKVENDYSVAFYVYVFVRILSAVSMNYIRLDDKPPSERVFAHFAKAITQFEVVAFFLAVLTMGSAWGFLETFLFWFLEDMGAGLWLLGIVNMIGGAAGIPFMFMYGPLRAIFGEINLITIGLIVFSFRLIGYSLINDPLLCLAFEALEGITNGLTVATIFSYAGKLATIETIASYQGIVEALHYGFGRGIGSLLGGFLLPQIGTQWTYRTFAGMTAVGAVLYSTYNLTRFGRRRYKRRSEKETSNIVSCKA